MICLLCSGNIDKCTRHKTFYFSLIVSRVKLSVSKIATPLLFLPRATEGSPINEPVLLIILFLNPNSRQPGVIDYFKSLFMHMPAKRQDTIVLPHKHEMAPVIANIIDPFPQRA
jgi:hypothetical protein